ncbi:hypothetical protein M231_07891 [Tremella mesenterica]|uniref:SET domain-containing protein n=1 Tax=Tremella mesenterica TaxID=5217 RepID=A0A4Q1BAZ4_TREME|nr:hypothetical protein M231_07891 [Tremella mesenterica]
MSRRVQVETPRPLPHPAEDLSEDDDLLSWVLVDQLGCLPNTKLGVHPQQVKFVGLPFKTEEVMSIIKETVVSGNTSAAMSRLQEFHLIRNHLEAKETDSQRERFVQHLRRYLLPLQPNSRIDIHTTSRYSAVTGHTELAVFATRPLAVGTVVSELQGSVVPLPDEWRQELDLGDEFALRAAAEEEAGSDDEADSQEREASRKFQGKAKMQNEIPRRQRRSDRTRRRDFSIVWSGLKNCFQLFLGPARFINHDCSPNVELLRQGHHVTFRTIQPNGGFFISWLMSSSKLTSDSLCLTCEIAGKGGFTIKESSLSRSVTRERVDSAGPSSQRSSNLSKRVTSRCDSEQVSESVIFGRDAESEDDLLALALADNISSISSKSVEASMTYPEDGTTSKAQSTPINHTPRLSVEGECTPSEGRKSPGEVRRRPSIRAAVSKMLPGFFARPPRRPRPVTPEVQPTARAMSEYPDDFPRCVTCCKPLDERVWYNKQYFDHCSRCVRHALIFGLPWPAHKPADIQDYPPAHLIPHGHIPRRISSVPLPSLERPKKKDLEPESEIPLFEEPLGPDLTKEERLADRFYRKWAEDDDMLEQQRMANWVAQETREANAKAQAEAKEAARLAKEEAKRNREKNKVRGSGIWNSYEYVSEDEMRKKMEERNALTTGTRRGKIYRPTEREAVEALEAQERLNTRVNTNSSPAPMEASTSSVTMTNVVTQEVLQIQQSPPRHVSNEMVNLISTKEVRPRKKAKRLSLKNPSSDIDEQSSEDEEYGPTPSPNNRPIPPLTSSSKSSMNPLPTLNSGSKEKQKIFIPTTARPGLWAPPKVLGTKRSRGRPIGTGKRQLASARLNARSSLASSDGPSKASSSKTLQVEIGHQKSKMVRGSSEEDDSESYSDSSYSDKSPENRPLKRARLSSVSGERSIKKPSSSSLNHFNHIPSVNVERNHMGHVQSTRMEVELPIRVKAVKTDNLTRFQSSDQAKSTISDDMTFPLGSQASNNFNDEIVMFEKNGRSWLGEKRMTMEGGKDEMGIDRNSDDSASATIPGVEGQSSDMLSDGESMVKMDPLGYYRL